MAKEINNETINEFINTKLSIEDFGYLVVPDDKQLNDEALWNIKNAFRKFIEEDNGGEFVFNEVT